MGYKQSLLLDILLRVQRQKQECREKGERKKKGEKAQQLAASVRHTRKKRHFFSPFFFDVTRMKARSSCDAAIAGALGAAAALCGKIAFDGRAARALMVRAAAAAGLAGATVASESVFARALASADSSLVPTVVSVSTNFILSVCFLSVCTHKFFLLFLYSFMWFKKGPRGYCGAWRACGAVAVECGCGADCAGSVAAGNTRACQERGKKRMK